MRLGKLEKSTNLPEAEIDRQTQRETDRERQTDRQTERERQTDRQKNMQTKYCNLHCTCAPMVNYLYIPGTILRFAVSEELSDLQVRLSP